MRGELITLHLGGAVTRKPLTTTDNYTDLSAAVGGGIELVPRFMSFEGRLCDAYVNDDGIHLGLPENREATRLWHAQLPGGAPGVAGSRLHGAVAIITGDAEFMAAVQGDEGEDER